MCFIILNDLYMAHHNLLGICRQLKIRHLYGTFNFSTQCICMGTGSWFVYRFSSFSWKGAPSTKENSICGSVNWKDIKLSVNATGCIRKLFILNSEYNLQNHYSTTHSFLCILIYRGEVNISVKMCFHIGFSSHLHLCEPGLFLYIWNIYFGLNIAWKLHNLKLTSKNRTPYWQLKRNNKC